MYSNALTALDDIESISDYNLQLIRLASDCNLHLGRPFSPSCQVTLSSCLAFSRSSDLAISDLYFLALFCNYSLFLHCSLLSLVFYFSFKFCAYCSISGNSIQLVTAQVSPQIFEFVSSIQDNRNLHNIMLGACFEQFVRFLSYGCIGPDGQGHGHVWNGNEHRISNQIQH